MFVFTMVDKLLTGKKPPDEINVIAKLNESKNLKSKIFKITKITNVSNVYKINIFDDCFICDPCGDGTIDCEDWGIECNQPIAYDNEYNIKHKTDLINYLKAGGEFSEYLPAVQAYQKRYGSTT